MNITKELFIEARQNLTELITTRYYKKTPSKCTQLSLIKEVFSSDSTAFHEKS
jgi:hypothetical protein